MSLFKSLASALHRASVSIGRTGVQENLLTMSDSRLQGSGLSREPVDPACALLQVIRELTCHNNQAYTKIYQAGQPLRRVIGSSGAMFQCGRILICRSAGEKTIDQAQCVNESEAGYTGSAGLLPNVRCWLGNPHADSALHDSTVYTSK